MRAEGEARAEAWQELKVCRCHGQCGNKEHRNRRQKPCQREGVFRCRDSIYNFAFYLCKHCACDACEKQQGGEAYGGLCFTCAGGKGGEPVPVSKRPAAAKLFFHSRKRAKLLQRPSAGAPKPCGVSVLSSGVTSGSSECVEPPVPLNIVLNFKQALRRCVPRDAQTFYMLQPDTLVHHEVFAMMPVSYTHLTLPTKRIV